jgi:valyl-tRNA synthetase
MNGVARDENFDPIAARVTVNRWIAGETARAQKAITRGIEEYKFNEAAAAAYQFVWNVFCDWYLELIKPILAGADEAHKAETRATAAWVIDQILLMLHPFMPFVTEELWHSMGKRPYELIVAKWPEPKALRDPNAAREIGGLVEVISDVRAMRAELNIPWSANLVPHVIGGDKAMMGQLTRNAATLARMAKVGAPVNSEHVPPSSAQIVVGGVTIAFPLEGAIDLEAERSRLSKAVAVAEKDRDSLAARLSNPAFTERAKPEAVDKARADHDARAAEAERLSAALARLG